MVLLQNSEVFHIACDPSIGAAGNRPVHVLLDCSPLSSPKKQLLGNISVPADMFMFLLESSPE